MQNYVNVLQAKQKEILGEAADKQEQIKILGDDLAAMKRLMRVRDKMDLMGGLIEKMVDFGCEVLDHMDIADVCTAGMVANGTTEIGTPVKVMSMIDDLTARIVDQARELIEIVEGRVQLEPTPAAEVEAAVADDCDCLACIVHRAVMKDEAIAAMMKAAA